MHEVSQNQPEPARVEGSERGTPAAPRRWDRWTVDSGGQGSQLGTAHPWWFIVLGPLLAIALVVDTFTAGGYLGLEGQLLLTAFALGLGALMMWPGIWSLRHRELARRAARRNWQRKADELRAHPLAQFVGLPLLIGALASFRAVEFWAHPTVPQCVLLGLAGVGFALLVQAIVALATRHLRSREWWSSSGERTVSERQVRAEG